MDGPVNQMAILSKTSEAVFSVAAAYLYLNDAPSDGPAEAT
ncbi:hypothetical protein C439_09475 [Haloferax mediterranei ATCC 33500]|uniref:Uncharacterized protein n=1 Tax=Haloferax mediterranei (strain ATCC 33500 / DSM 1411 / JCM 8866 / NBRC 14739 / NCIMB 2177 / R-4) TaxID=523841 RepID=M0J0Z4_HALMT|nr:hypothetical protein C439_09475 [Haloferax mediterranei ATCC 33500]